MNYNNIAPNFNTPINKNVSNVSNVSNTRPHINTPITARVNATDTTTTTQTSTQTSTNDTDKQKKTLMKYADISNYYKISDYLPILNGCINSELTVMYIAYCTLILTIGNTDALKIWHEKYTFTLSIWSITTMMTIIVLTRLFYTMLFNEFTIYKFTILSVIIQAVYNLLYYLLFYHKMSNEYKVFNYLDVNSKDVTYRTLTESITLIILACIFSSNFATYTVNSNLILLIVSVYFIPFFIYNS
jgi:hypothetical protein